MVTEQTSLELGARQRTRLGDPETSKDASAKLTHMRASQARVLAMFKLYGDLHDKQLIEYLHDAEKSAGLKPMSESGVRSRRSELAKPNMERLDEIALELTGVNRFGDMNNAGQVKARAMLLVEGLRAPLWDTGKRATVDGRRTIVWGLAK
jgi:hypothetical protein